MVVRLCRQPYTNKQTKFEDIFKIELGNLTCKSIAIDIYQKIVTVFSLRPCKLGSQVRELTPPSYTLFRLCKQLI